MTACWTQVKNYFVFGLHLRQDAGDGKQLGHQVRQVAVHEDEEGLDLTDVVGEACGERSHESEQKAEEDASGRHHGEPGNSQKHISGFNNRQVCQKGKHAVKYLERERPKKKITHSTGVDK